MRTTLTLDEDVAAALDEFIRLQPGGSFKQAVNELLRSGLHTRKQVRQALPFRVTARSLGQHPGLAYDNINGLLEELEGPLHR